MHAGGALILLELAAPAMVIDGGQSAEPQGNLGGEPMDLNQFDVALQVDPVV